MNSFDLKFINEAHNIAEKNFGKTFPNPVVGCVIAKNGKLISKGVTSKSGRPHAEEIAIRTLLPQEIDTYDPYDGEVKVWQI